MDYHIYVSDQPNQDEDSLPLKTPSGKTLWIRIVEYRGGSDSLEYAERHERKGESLLNAVTLPQAQ